MGLTKTILFGDDPAHDGIGAAWSKATADRIRERAEAIHIAKVAEWQRRWEARTAR